jgi:hypothetical protein
LWGYVDDAFEAVHQYNAANGTNKTVMLSLTPGVYAPSWFLSGLTPCDPLFQTGVAHGDLSKCGRQHFVGFSEANSVLDDLPLPWDATYKSAWASVVKIAGARYSGRKELVAVSVAGPTASSAEMILPNDSNSCANLSCPGYGYTGWAAEQMWNVLLAQSPYGAASVNTDNAFIAEWNDAVGVYERAFSNVTVMLLPDAGIGFPRFGGQPLSSIPSTTFYETLCQSTNPNTGLSCQAIASIVATFLATGGTNANGVGAHTGGMTASTAMTLAGNDIGVAGVRWMSLDTMSNVTTLQAVAGDMFDHPFSSDKYRQQQGCLQYPKTFCDKLSPEQAEYNTLKVFFSETKGAKFFHDAPLITAPSPTNFVRVSSDDIAYATLHQCDLPTPITDPDGTKASFTAQDLLNVASALLYKSGEPALPAPSTASTACTACTVDCGGDQVCIGGRCVSLCGGTSCN